MKQETEIGSGPIKNTPVGLPATMPHSAGQEKMTEACRPSDSLAAGATVVCKDVVDVC